MPKIKEVDDFISAHKTEYSLREMHPEVAFWSLNKYQAMKFNKKKKEGYSERLLVLKKHYNQSDSIVNSGLTQYFRNQVTKDDILDALAGAVLAMNHETLKTLPDEPEVDEQGLKMEIVYL